MAAFRDRMTVEELTVYVDARLTACELRANARERIAAVRAAKTPAEAAAIVFPGIAPRGATVEGPGASWASFATTVEDSAPVVLDYAGDLVAAIKMLRELQRATLDEPVTVWSMFQHAINRAEGELDSYVRGAR